MARGSVFVALVAAVLAVGGAGAATGTTVAVVAGKPKELSLRLTPKTVPPGAVVFKVLNQGKLPHRFQIAGKATPVLLPGRSATLSVKLAAGTFVVTDAVKGRTGTAKGVLYVSPPAGSGSIAPPKAGGGTTAAGAGATGSTPATSGNAPGDVNAGRQIFLTVGCTGCHTLKAAGSSGGIDLDALAPDVATAIDNITNGNSAGMPEWASQLSKTQIQNVAAFVYCSTHAGAC